ncbi:alpha/beta hydrolase [Roseivirga sp. BDSF3-8]|uniref:alpha/beta hydrolase n=1 Tax=Roseivirga sp. BDSF3-8 TaxID=3241598 RepID=UPI0035323CD8
MIIHNEPVATAGVPLKEAKKVCVMVHGRGDSASRFIRMHESLQVDEMAFVAPQAIAHSWYPQPFTAPLSRNQPQLDMGLSALDEMMDDLDGLGFQRKCIYFLGFSQGACLLLEYLARHARKVGGVVALSGGLIGPRVDHKRYGGDFEQTPFFLGCSVPDPHIPEQRVHDSEKQLQSLNAKVYKRLYADMGHTVNDEELHFAESIFRGYVD